MTSRAVSWQAIAAVVVIGLVAWAVYEIRAEPPVEQPIEFPHRTHVELNLECTSCHDRADRDAVAGRPPTALCLSCHAGDDGSPEIRKVQAFEAGGEIPWRRVWRMPSHVYFPHRTHVVAEVPCQTCHGPMETLDRPPARPLKKVTMDDCIACHEKRRDGGERRAGPVAVVAARAISTDCNACHR
jgi:hypothetical protein